VRVCAALQPRGGGLCNRIAVQDRTRVMRVLLDHIPFQKIEVNATALHPFILSAELLNALAKETFEKDPHTLPDRTNLVEPTRV
jgi:hypothetical protein